MLIDIVRSPGAQTEQVDEVLLQKLETVQENDDCRLTAVEYCLQGCPGEAHVKGEAVGDGCFCSLHVHRSAHAVMKRWPDGMGAVAGAFT